MKTLIRRIVKITIGITLLTIYTSGLIGATIKYVDSEIAAALKPIYKRLYPSEGGDIITEAAFHQALDTALRNKTTKDIKLHDENDGL